MPFTPRPTSSAGGGNATVPNDAPIQPPQAFVDCTLLEALTATANGAMLNWSNRGITSFDASNAGILEQLDVASYNAFGRGINLNLAGNSIPDTNAILSKLVTDNYSNGTLDISGGTNAEPTGGAANADIITLVGNGWTVICNIEGVPTTFPTP